MNRLLSIFVVAAFAGCDCSGGPGTGVCNGTWGGVSFVDAGLDLSSRMVIEYTTDCTLKDRKRYELSWQQAALTLNFTSRNPGPSSLLPIEVNLPPADGGTYFETYALNPDVPGSTGSLRLTILGLRGRRGGVLDLNAGAEQLTCVFDVPYTREGMKICASSGGGGDGD